MLELKAPIFQKNIKLKPKAFIFQNTLKTEPKAPIFWLDVINLLFKNSTKLLGNQVIKLTWLT